MIHAEKRRIHFVGVGGIGMSGLAEILLNLGYAVSGSDLAASEITNRLAGLGLDFYTGHSAPNAAADIVVVSAAIPEDNPEVLYAREHGIPVMHRSDLLADIIRMKPNAVVVGGTHGKTTTTSMIGAILDEADIGATTVVGGILRRSGTNARWGRGDYIVAEADEHDGSFLRLHPTIALVTNIDAEHLEYYGTVHQLQRSFIDFCNGIPFYGTAILCGDDPNTVEIMPGLSTNIVTYGLNGENALQGENLRLLSDDNGAPPTLDNVTTRIDVVCHDSRLAAVGSLGAITVKTLGADNARNALGACAAGLCLGIPFERIAAGLKSFEGVQRRLQLRGEVRGVTVVEDYAHHPTELASTLNAIRMLKPKRVIAIFQPHLYSRTKYLHQEFAEVLTRFDRAIVTDIYGSREEPIEGVTSELIVDAALKLGAGEVEYLPSKEDVPAALAKDLGEGDIVALLGAGDINRMAGPLLDALGGA